MTYLEGTILDVVCILLGTAMGFVPFCRRLLALSGFAQLALGTGCIVAGLWWAWFKSGTSFLETAVNFLVGLGSLVIGRILGRLVGVQRLSNRLGASARRWFESVPQDTVRRRSVGFKTAIIVFCVSPIAVFGPVAEGACEWKLPMIFKSIMDGFAALGFGVTYGWVIALACFALFPWQGTIALLSYELALLLESAAVIQVLNVTCGLLLCFSGVVVLGIRRVELANYLPALVIAPLARLLLG